MASKREREREHERRMAEERATVDAKLASLKGQSRADLEADDRRGASSPLGMGTTKRRQR
jgi:hypothetical protein